MVGRISLVIIMDFVWAIFYSFTTKNVMKNIKYQTVGTVPKSNNKHIVETLNRGKMDTLNTICMYITAHFLGFILSIKNSAYFLYFVLLGLYCQCITSYVNVCHFEVVSILSGFSTVVLFLLTEFCIIF